MLRRPVLALLLALGLVAPVGWVMAAACGDDPGCACDEARDEPVAPFVKADCCCTIQPTPERLPPAAGTATVKTHAPEAAAAPVALPVALVFADPRAPARDGAPPGSDVPLFLRIRSLRC